MRKMYLIFVLIFTVIVHAQDSDESKYIDLLSDTEKEEFLESVARRISEKVLVKNVSNKSSVEIPDADLNEHDSFVKKILREELDNRRDNKVSTEEVEGKEDSDENMQVKPLNKDNERLDDDHIDLTLRTNKVKRRDIASEKLSVRSVEVITENIETVTTNLDHNSKDISIKTYTVNNLNGKHEHDEIDNHGTSLENKEEKNVRVIDNINITDSDSVKYNQNITNHEYKVPEIEDPRKNAFGAQNSTENIRILLPISAEKIPTNILINKSSEQSRTLQTSNIDINESAKGESSTISIENVTPNIVNIPLTNDTRPKPILRTDGTDNYSKSNLKKWNRIEYETKGNNSEIYTTLAIVNSTPTASIEGSLVGVVKKQEPKKEFTTKLKAKDVKNVLKVNINKSNTIEISSKNETNNVGTDTQSVTTSDFAEKAIHLLRNSLLLIDEDEDSVKHIQDNKFSGQDNYKKHSINDKTYQVREIRPYQLPFIKDSVVVTENPYHAPIYNYSIYNAYYNPKNRHEPNVHGEVINENIEKFPNHAPTHIKIQENNHKRLSKDKEYNHFATFNEKSSLEMGDLDTIYENQRKKFNIHGKYAKPTYKAAKEITYYIPLPVPNRHKKIIPQLYNPNDYMDIDYFERVMRYTGRAGPVKFPDSDEASHPYNSLSQKNIKNHLRAVRNIFYNNNIFGYPKPFESQTTTEIATSNETEGSVTTYFRSGVDNSNIALDYYFGRMTPEKREKNIYDKNLNNFNYEKNIIHNDSFVKNEFKKYNINNKEKYKDDMYFDGDQRPATPHTDFKFEEKNLKFTFNNKRNKIMKRNNKKNEKVDNKTNDKFNTISEIIDITDEKDAFVILQMLQHLNLSLSRRQDDTISVYLRVLKDMIHVEDNSLKQYDWIGTTVDILSAIIKLLSLTEAAQNGDYIHPSDLELLKYMVLLHQLSEDPLEGKGLMTRLRKLLPKNKKRKRHFLTDKGLLNRVWLLRSNTSVEHGLDKFKQFLVELQNSLYDLHEAILNIANVAKFSNQNWFNNIKDLHFTTSEKSYLDLLLHLEITRLFGLIEESATKGMDADLMSYLMENKEQQTTVTTMKEIIFVKQILNEIKRVD